MSRRRSDVSRCLYYENLQVSIQLSSANAPRNHSTRRRVTARVTSIRVMSARHIECPDDRRDLSRCLYYENLQVSIQLRYANAPRNHSTRRRGYCTRHIDKSDVCSSHRVPRRQEWCLPASEGYRTRHIECPDGRRDLSRCRYPKKNKKNFTRSQKMRPHFFILIT